MPIYAARLRRKGDLLMTIWIAHASLAMALAAPMAAQANGPAATGATSATASTPASVNTAPVEPTPFSFDLNALPHAEALPPPIDPIARPRIVLTDPMTPPPPAGTVATEGGYSRSQSVATAAPQASNGRRCERTPSGGTRCTTILIQSSNGAGERVAAELNASTARLEDSVNRELDRLSNPPPQ